MVKRYYTDTCSYSLLVEADNVYKEICCDVGIWHHTPNYDERRRKRPSLARKNKTMIELMKDQNSGKIVKKFAKSYSYCVQKYAH